MEYLYKGAIEGHPGVYVSLDMADDIFREQGRQFGWDIAKLEKEDKLAIVKVPWTERK
jgi:RecA-superfamily ATPases implicated in signal transduction